MGSHWLLFTPACIFVMFAVYFFMTGEYQFYAAQVYWRSDPNVQACLASSNTGGSAYGARQMTRWMWPNVRCPTPLLCHKHGSGRVLMPLNSGYVHPS